MGQEEVLKAVEDFGFTTLQELHEELGLTIPSITHSLTTLTKWKEVEFVTTGQQRRVYFSVETIQFLEEILEYE